MSGTYLFTDHEIIHSHVHLHISPVEAWTEPFQGNILCTCSMPELSKCWVIEVYKKFVGVVWLPRLWASSAFRTRWWIIRC